MRRSGVVWLLLFPLLGAAGCFWFFSALGRSFDLCGNDVLATALSPDGAIKAVLFERDCGATTGFTEQISLLNSGDALPDQSGNIFQAEGGGRNDIRSRMRWKDNNTLNIDFPQSAKIWWKKTRRDVKTGWFTSHWVRIVYE